MSKCANTYVPGTGRQLTLVLTATQNDIQQLFVLGSIHILQETFSCIFNVILAHLSKTYLVYVWIICNKSL